MVNQASANIPDPVIEWLLEPENPSVRYFTLQNLVKDHTIKMDLSRERETIMTQGLVPLILEKQNPDGSWDIPEKFYNAKYKGTVWTLLLLAELAADPNDARIHRACEFILTHSQHPESGGFSYTTSAKTRTGLASGVIPCLSGNLTYSLIKLGYLDDPRVQQAINWITTVQRADDGDCGAPAGEFYQRYEMCWGSHSCHMGVAKALKALAAIPLDQRTPDVRVKIDELAEYFLIHHLYKKSHDLSQVSRPGWLRLTFPLMYQTDILELLGLFADLDIRDPRLDDAIEILRNRRQPDGRWILDNSFNGKMQVRVEQKGKPSKWITWRALKVLNWFT